MKSNKKHFCLIFFFKLRICTVINFSLKINKKITFNPCILKNEILHEKIIMVNLKKKIMNYEKKKKKRIYEI